MCGITGIYNFNQAKVNENQLREMNQAISHRGPDNDGVYIDENFGMGHRRLSILDLSEAGNQPMSSRNGNLIISFSGMVYNFLDLKQELEKLGYKFKSKTDTEVVVNSIEEWGIDSIKKFNGMFAFAIWDKKDKKLTIARDRFGIKPLYYFLNNNRFIFGSEIKAILKNIDTPTTVDLKALKEYFTFQNVYSDRTLFEGIKILPQAHILEIEKDGKIKFHKYWDWKFVPESIDFNDCTKELKSILEKSIKGQLVSDVPLGSYLSGGMDTGTIVAIASKYIPNLKTFTIGFDLSLATGIEMLFDERKEAELIANSFDTQSYQMVLRPGNMEQVIPKLIWHIEDPRVGMCYQNYYLTDLASKFVKVALDGTGGDEVFSGYTWRYCIFKNCKDNNDFNSKLFNYWQRIVNVDDHKKFFVSKVFSEVRDYHLFDLILNVFKNWDYNDDNNLNKVFYFDAMTFLNGLLQIGDKISMAHALETRVPFLDNNLVDFVCKIPVEFKVDLDLLSGNNSFNSLGGKKILRKAMSGIIPNKIINADKKGFSTPEASWYRGPSLDYIKKILLDKNTYINDFIRKDFVEKTIHEHLSGAVNHRLLIWSLLNFEWWIRIFINKDNIEM